MTELDSNMILKKISKYTKKGVPFMDAVVEYADEEGIEIEVLGEIIRRSPVLKSKIYDEAVELNMVEKYARLPV